MSKYSWAKALAPGHMGMGPWPWAHGPPPPGHPAQEDEPQNFKHSPGKVVPLCDEMA